MRNLADVNPHLIEVHPNVVHPAPLLSLTSEVGGPKPIAPVLRPMPRAFAWPLLNLATLHIKTVLEGKRAWTRHAKRASRQLSACNPAGAPAGVLPDTVVLVEVVLGS